MAKKNEKTGEISILTVVFCHNVPNNIHKTNSNHKVHALVTKSKKKIWKTSTGYLKMRLKKK